jgi:hypothetical protein
MKVPDITVATIFNFKTREFFFVILYITRLPCVGNFSHIKQILWKTTVSSELLKCAITNFKIVCLHISDNAVTEWLEILENTKKI